MSPTSKRRAPVSSFSDIHSHCALISSEIKSAFSDISSDEFLSKLGAIPYPYDTLFVIDEFKRLLGASIDELIEDIPNNWFLDIGGAHGEVTFLFERAGFRSTYVDVLKEGHTFPHIASALSEALGSSSSILTMDVDESFDSKHILSSIKARYGEDERFGLAFFSGVFYHLKNPYRVLESIRSVCNYCMMTTRIFSHEPENGLFVGDISAAYFLKNLELNDDPTNYFVFTQSGLRNIVERSGFEILAMERTHSREDKVSDPTSMDKMEVAYLLLKSKF